jgi:ABC-2 type transport system ATP-binding protein
VIGPPGARPAVLARGTAFRYPSGRTGLAALDLEVRPGEVVAVIGPNGSGKSTLLRLLATDLRPAAGDLRILGHPAASPTPALRRRIAWVPDDQGHLPSLTGRENARFLLEVRGVEAAAGLERLLEAFALEEVADLPVARYSFGMRRKLLLAEAFAASPELLLLDEPTVGLDPPALGVFRDAVRQAAGRGAAAVVATNEVRSVPEWAARVIFLLGGRVVQDSDPESLLRSVRGTTRIRIRVDGEMPSVSIPEGARVLLADGDRLEVESRDDGLGLPSILDALVRAGARIRDVRVREPDLGDLFRARTGEALSGEADR